MNNKSNIIEMEVRLYLGLMQRYNISDEKFCEKATKYLETLTEPLYLNIIYLNRLYTTKKPFAKVEKCFMRDKQVYIEILNLADSDMFDRDMKAFPRMKQLEGAKLVNDVDDFTYMDFVIGYF